MYSVIFDGFNNISLTYYKCVIFINNGDPKPSLLYNIALEKNIKICSDLLITPLPEERTHNDLDVRKAFLEAENNGHSITIFEDKVSNVSTFQIQRFTEFDFDEIIKELGGKKILESKVLRPDYDLHGLVIELKNLQEDSLNNPKKQKSLAEIFSFYKNKTVNLKTLLDHKSVEWQVRTFYNKLLKSFFNKASDQIKSYKRDNEILSAGLVLLNTGHYTLNHQLLLQVCDYHLKNSTTTIEYVLVITQTVVGNSHNIYPSIEQNFLGSVPEEIEAIIDTVNKRMERKMTEAITGKAISKMTILPQEPISFLVDEKIFYWAPEKIKKMWE